jgi:hypothetical protein
MMDNFMGAWIGSLRRVLLPLITFTLGVVVKLDPGLTVKDDVIGGLVIAVLFAADEYFTNLRPARQLKEVGPIAMDTAAGPLIASMKAQSVDVRMSVFKVVRPPAKRFRKQFKMMWNINMTDHPDVNLSFPADLGVSGKCLKDKKPYIADETGIASLPLPTTILDTLGDNKLKAVAACPIYEAKRKGWQSGRVIGVLNLDSYDDHAYALFVSSGGDITRKMKQLAGLAAHIFG